jgi:hypothetical protein
MRNMLVGLIVGCVLSGAAGAAHAKDAKPPAELIVTFARGDSTSLDGMRAFIDAIKPGTGAMMSDAIIDMGIANVTGVAPLDGLDHGAAMYVLFVDGGNAKGFAVVGKVADASRLPSGGGTTVASANGWAVLGPAAVVKKVQAYAFAALATAPMPTAPTVTFYSASVLTRYHSQIETMRRLMLAQMQAQGNAMGGLAQAYVDGLFSVLADSDRAVVTLDADKDEITFDLALAPKAGSKLSSFVAVQLPSDYAMLGQLPASSPMLIAAGHFESGPYHQGLLDLMTTMYGANGSKDLVQMIDAIMKGSTGDVAFGMDMGGSKGMIATSLVGVSDHKAVDAAVGKLIDALAKARSVQMVGIPVTLQATAAAAQHDGVAIRGYDTTYDLSALPELKRKEMLKVLGGSNVSHAAMATFDKLAVFAIAGTGDAVAAAGSDIDAARGKGSRYKPTKEVQRALDASRARKDSAVMIMDFGAFAAMMPTPTKLTGAMVMTAGFADGTAHLRMSLASATFKAAVPKQP